MNQIEIANQLDHAQNNQKELTRFTKEVTDLSIDAAYEIQKLTLDMRLKRGEKQIGFKMGLTSKAKMEQMGVKEPIWGYLNDVHQVQNEGQIPFDRLIHPKVEPEIALIAGDDWKPGSDIDLTSFDDAARDWIWSKCEGVCLGAEVIDSRYLNFEFKLP